MLPQAKTCLCDAEWLNCVSPISIVQLAPLGNKKGALHATRAPRHAAPPARCLDHRLAAAWDCDSYDGIALFVAPFDISVCLGSLFQRIACIYDRCNCPHLNQIFEEG